MQQEKVREYHNCGSELHHEEGNHYLFIDQSSTSSGITIIEDFPDGFKMKRISSFERGKLPNHDIYRHKLEKHLVELIKIFNVEAIIYEQPYEDNRLNFDRLKIIVNMETLIRDIKYRYYPELDVIPIPNTSWKTVIFQLYNKPYVRDRARQKALTQECILISFPQLKGMVEDCFDSTALGIAWICVLRHETNYKKIRYKIEITNKPKYDIYKGEVKTSIDETIKFALSNEKIDRITLNDVSNYIDFGSLLLQKNKRYDDSKIYYANAVRYK